METILRSTLMFEAGNSPHSLLHLTARNVAFHLEALRPSDNQDFHIPREVGEKILGVAREEGIAIGDSFLKTLSHVTEVSRAGIRDSTISDTGLNHLLGPKLRELELHNCPALTVSSLQAITRHGNRLQQLSIMKCVKIFPGNPQLEAGGDPHCQDIGIDLPDLRRLTLHDVCIKSGAKFFDHLLRPLGQLTHLDLSSAFHAQGMHGFQWLLNVPRLVSLTLHNVKNVEESLESLVQLKDLRHLDISQCNEAQGVLEPRLVEPSQFLERLVIALTKLVSLDISGTNLAGSSADCSEALCDIRGLSSRVDRPLEFLGLYKTKHSACSWNNIPANLISGDSTEDQILEAGWRYMSRTLRPFAS